MDKKTQAYFQELHQDIMNAYETTPTIEESEKFAAKFLSAQIRVGSELSKADLDSRMKKQGVKAVRAAVYLENATKGDKKPSDVMLQALVDRDEVTTEAQRVFDEAEVYKNELDNYLNVFQNAHLYFRNLSKGRYE